MYPTYPFRDDSVLSKPNLAYDWLHFHDAVTSRVFSGQEWELAEYLSQPILAFHHLFGSSSPRSTSWGSGTEQLHRCQQSQRVQDRGGEKGVIGGDDEGEAGELDFTPFTGPRADFSAREAEKQNRSILSGLLASFSVHLARSFRSPEDIATELLPYLNRLVSPEVKPVVVGGGGDQKGVASVRTHGERDLIRRAVNVMHGIGVTFQRCRVEGETLPGRAGTWVYRMEP